MKKPLEVVVVAGVFATFALVGVKLFVTHPASRLPEKMASVVTVASSQAAGAAVAPKASLKDILLKIQRGDALSIEEQRELDRLARENGAGLATAIAETATTDDAPPPPEPPSKRRTAKADKKAFAAFGDMSGADIAANLKTPGKPDDKADAFVKTAFPNMTLEQQKAISAGIVKKVASSKKEDGAPVPVPIPQ